MGLPIPAMLTDKFCGFLELDMGLRVLSLVYLGFWCFYAVLEMVFGVTYMEMIHALLPESIEEWITISWCILSAIAYLLVVIGIQINNRMLLLPGILMSIGNIVLSGVQAALHLITIIGMFSAIGGFIFCLLLAYYTICLKALYDKMGAAAPPPMECQEHFDQV